MPTQRRRKSDMILALGKELLLPALIKFVSVLLGLIFGPKITKEEQDELFGRKK